MNRYDDPKTIPAEVATNAAVALKNIVAAEAIPLNGCGRVYVMIGYKKMLKSHAVAKALTAMGFKLTPRPGFTGLALYVGYDNATGRQWSLAHAYAETLKGYEITAYADVDGD